MPGRRRAGRSVAGGKPERPVTVLIQRPSGARLPLSRAEIAKLVQLAAPCRWPAGAQVELVFTDDRGIAALNRSFLHRRGATDVIAFPLEDPPAPPSDRTAAAVVISLQTARREARRRGKCLRGELALYLVHGLLHLAGYDDATAAQRRRMYRRERELLAQAGLTDAR